MLRELNEEAVKTKEDKQKDVCKWTTFLQKPNRPIPKSKEELAREKLPVYKVNIVKQQKPRVAPDREPTPPPQQQEEEEVVEPEPENATAEEPAEEESKQEIPNESVNENEEQVMSVEEIEQLVAETMDNEVPDLVPEEGTGGLPTELEKQLADVQKQLLALSNLPQAIQATLDAVTSELAKIVPVIQEVASKQASVDRDYRSKSLSRDIEPPTEMIVIEETVEESLELEEKPKEEHEEVAEERDPSSCSSSESSQDDGCSMSSMGTPAVNTDTKEKQLEDHQKELREAIQNRRNDVRKQRL